MRSLATGWIFALCASASGLSVALPAAGAGTGTRIPIVPGLTIVTAVHEEEGDYESIKRIVKVEQGGYSLQYSADVPVVEGGAVDSLFGDLVGEPAKGERKTRQVESRRTVLRDDLVTAREYLQHFSESLPATIPGTTALGVSRAVLVDLKTRGKATIAMRNVGPFGAVGTGISNLIQGMAGELAGAVETSGLEAIDKIAGTLERVSERPATFQVLLNGRPEQLSVLQARGRLGEQPVDITLLDDPDNPLALAWKIGEFDSLRVVQIQLPAGKDSASPPAGIEQQLAGTGRVAVYGIYFDFDSAAIKPESGPVLDEIAAALQRHRGWKLSIEGHTDSIGSEVPNRQLSERRAAAVKSALVDRHGIEKVRLSTAGHGESRPKASNETLEGRALNRRVELVRLATGDASAGHGDGRK